MIAASEIGAETGTLGQFLFHAHILAEEDAAAAQIFANRPDCWVRTHQLGEAATTSA